MDARLLMILRSVAYGELCFDDGGGECFFSECAGDDIYKQYETSLHSAQCPVTMSRAILAEHGVPLLLYRIDLGRRYASFFDWHPQTFYRLAFQEEELHDFFHDDPDPDDPRNAKMRNVKMRNVQFTVIGEAQNVLPTYEEHINRNVV